MRHEEYQYLDLMREVLFHGNDKMDRTGVGTKSIFGAQMRFDLSKGFPLFTTKKVWWKGVVHELLWLLSGNTNIKYLTDNGVHIWDEWADKDGNLGPVYGKQWRNWDNWNNDSYQYDKVAAPVDQIAQVIESIKSNPDSRRHIVSAWNVGDIPDMALPPCHTMFQFYVADGKLSCQLYQRSCDLGLGASFNVASYSLLTMMIGQVCNLQPGFFIHSIGDCHIYKNHFSQIEEQIKREPFSFPRVELDPTITNIDDFKYEHIRLLDYKSHAGIKMDVAV